MNVRHLALALAVVVCVTVAGRPLAASDDVANIKDLYAAASYEEALAELSKADDLLAPDFAEQYRALCLLALGRAPEAEQALERLVSARPLLKLDANEVPPKLLAMHQEVRKRQLPELARELYVRGKSNFESKNYLVASSELKTLMAVLSDEDMAEVGDSFSDLKVLGDGFLKLTALELESAAKAAAAAAPPPPPPAPVVPAGPADGIYSDADAGVVQPVELSRRMPAWIPPPALVTAQYQGTLELVIDQRGAVEAARIADPITPLYDQALVEAAKDWEFAPARKDGLPVKYRKVIRVVLSGR